MKVPGSNTKTLRGPEIGDGAAEPTGSGNEATRVGAMLSSDQLLESFQDPGNYIDDMRNISISYLSREVLQVIDDELHQLTMVHFGESDDIAVLARIYTPGDLNWAVDTIRMERSTITAPMTRQVGSQQHGNTLTESKTGFAVNTKRNIKEFVCDLDLEFLDAWLVRKGKYLRVVMESFAIDYKAMIYEELMNVPKISNKVRANETVWFHEYVEPYFMDLGLFNRGGNKAAESLVVRAEAEMFPNTEKKPTNLIITHRMAAANNFTPAMLYQENGPSAGSYVRGGRNTLVMEGGATAVMCSIRDKIQGKDYIVTQEVWNGDFAISMDDPFTQSISFYSFLNDRYNTFTNRQMLNAFIKLYFTDNQVIGGLEASTGPKFAMPSPVPVPAGSPRSKCGPFLDKRGRPQGLVGTFAVEDENRVFLDNLREWIGVWMSNPLTKAKADRHIAAVNNDFATAVDIDTFLTVLLGDFDGNGRRENFADYPSLAFLAYEDDGTGTIDYNVTRLTGAGLQLLADETGENMFPNTTTVAAFVDLYDRDIAALSEFMTLFINADDEVDRISAWYLTLPMNSDGLKQILDAGLPLPFALGAFSYNLFRGDTAILAADKIGFSFMSEIKVNSGQNIEGIQEITRAQNKSGIITSQPECVYRATLALIFDTKIAAGTEFVTRNAKPETWHEQGDGADIATLVPYAIGYQETQPMNKLVPTFTYESVDENTTFHESRQAAPDAALMFSHTFKDSITTIKSGFAHSGNEWNSESGHHRFPFLAERVTVDVKSSLEGHHVVTREFDSTFPSNLRNGSKARRFAKVPLGPNHSTTISLRG